MTLATDALAIARAGIAAVDPARAVARAIVVEGDRVRVAGRALTPPGGARVRLVAFGKAAAAMADAAIAALGPHAGASLAVVRRGNPPPRAAIEWLEGDHPVPTVRSERAGRRLLEFVGDGPADGPTLFLVSGGASALVEVPAEGLTIADVAATNERLLASGAPIQAMNTVRRHLSRIKGGRLALATRSHRVATLAISDVVGDAPSDVASGPTVGDPTRFAEALAVVDRYRLRARLPRAVVRHLDAGARGDGEENPSPSDPRLAGHVYRFVATNRRALTGAAAEARRRGFVTTVLGGAVVGETQAAGIAFARRLRGLGSAPGGAGRCLLAGGETTVTLGAQHGRGGRNQEFALAGARVLAGEAFVHLLSLGTDGIDGPTDAAGGCVDGATLDRARNAGVDLDRAVAMHDAYPALVQLGGLIRTGPTGTNVMDLHVGLSARAGGRGRSTPRPDGAASRRRRS